jgi:hypothetical protein
MDVRADDTPTEDRLKADIQICHDEERRYRKTRHRYEKSLLTLQNRRCDDGGEAIDL